MRHEINLNEFSSVIREFSGYKSAIQGCSPRTVEEYLLDLRTFFRYLLAREDEAVLHNPEKFAAVDVREVGLDRLREVTAGDIYDFLLFVDADRENQSSAKARKLSAIKSLFGFLTVKRGYLTVNPAANIESPKRKKALPKYLTLDEARMLLGAVSADTESPHRTRDFCIITLFLNCGMRVSELVGISLTDIDPQLRSLRVVGKGSKERIVYLNEACRAALTDWLGIRLGQSFETVPDLALFLSNRNTRFSDKGVQHMVYKYLEIAGLGPRRFSVHKLRHTAATLMYQSGEVDIRVLKDILGHEQLNTTQIYTHLSDAGMEDAMRHNPLNSITEPLPRLGNGAYEAAFSEADEEDDAFGGGDEDDDGTDTDEDGFDES